MEIDQPVSAALYFLHTKVVRKLFTNISSAAVGCLLKKLKEQAREQAKDRKPNLVKALKEMGDFYMELKWDFQSWGEFSFK